MKTTLMGSEQQQTRHATWTKSVEAALGGATHHDHRASLVAQRQLIAAMANSPQAVVQREIRQRLNSSSRMVMQHKFVSREPLQRIEEDDLKQKKSVQLKNLEEEKPRQYQMVTKSPVQRKQEPVVATPNNTGLPDRLKSGIESLSGMSLDAVRVHYNSSQPAQLNALAYAQGTNIHIAPGQEQHLPHEAWHVVQQAQGRVQPTMQMKEGVSVNDDRSLEHEADVMGQRALQIGTANLPSIQRKCVECAENEGEHGIAQRKSKMNYHSLPTLTSSTIVQRACYFFKNADCQGRRVYGTSKHNFSDFDSYNCSGERGGADCVENDGRGHCAC